MKTATAKELRNRAAAILETVSKGEEVIITKRGKSIAVVRPIENLQKEFSPVGFGIWKDRKDLSDVGEWLKERRKERFQK